MAALWIVLAAGRLAWLTVSRERLRVASRDFVRILEYQSLFIERMREAMVIQENLCPGGERIAAWYLCP